MASDILNSGENIVNEKSSLITVISESKIKTPCNVTASDVFVDATDSTPVRDAAQKPSRKRTKVVISNSSEEAGSTIDSDDGEDVMEEGEIDISTNESGKHDEKDYEENVKVNEGTLLKILNECKSLSKEIDSLKQEKKDWRTEVTQIVKETIAKEIKTVMNQVVTIVNKECKSVDDKLRQKIEKIGDSAQTGIAGNVLEEVFDRISYLENKQLDLESRSRRSNMIIHGVTESHGESPMNIVHDIIRFECGIKDEIIIERAHRLGRKRQGRIRPIIVKFLDYNDKMYVKSRRFDLPDSLSFSDDLPLAIRLAQRKLEPELKKAKDQGHEAYIQFPATLVVEGRPVVVMEPITNSTQLQTEIDSSRPNSSWQPATQHNAKPFKRGHNNSNINGQNNKADPKTRPRNGSAAEAPHHSAQDPTHRSDRNHSTLKEAEAEAPHRSLSDRTRERPYRPRTVRGESGDWQRGPPHRNGYDNERFSSGGRRGFAPRNY